MSGPDTTAPDARRVLLPGDGVTVAAMAALAAGHGWEFGVDQPRGHVEERQLQWTTGPGTGVVWIENHVVGVRHLLVVERDDARADALAALLRERLDVLDPDAVLDEAVTVDDPVLLVRALPRLALLPLPPDEPRCLAAFGRALTHPLRPVRRAAVVPVLGRLTRGEPWPGLRGLVEARVPDEPSPGDERLRSLLAVVDEHGPR